MLLAIPFPAIDPVALQIGPIAIHWYALAYIAGFILGWRYCLRLADRDAGRPSRDDFDGFLTWAVVGVILGGRIGYVLFYNLEHYLQNPLHALAVWQGGMAFHGGLLGVVLAIILFARFHRFSPFRLADMVSCAAPIGLFFGRITNFINGELFGRPTDVPWAVVFPAGGNVPRHPSQLYEAVLEGLVLFVVLALMARHKTVRDQAGLLSGVFLFGYGLSRFLVEFVREPDPQLGFLVVGTTMGQLLSLPMILAGLTLIVLARRGRLPA